MTNTDFLMWRKRVCCFENLLSDVQKTNSPVFWEKYSKESNRVERNWGNLYCSRCCFNFYTFFFNYTLFFILYSFYSFYARLFQVHTCVPCVQVATPLLTTSPVKLITSCSRKFFFLLPFPRKIHRQTPFKDDRAASKSALKKKTKQNNKNSLNAFHGWQ